MMGRAPKVCGHLDCTELVRGRTYCPAHTPAAWQGGRKSGRKRGPAYERARQRVLGRAGYHCQIQYADICIGVATEVDHIKPAYLGGTDDDSNMQAACSRCHARKSATEGGHARGMA